MEQEIWRKVSILAGLFTVFHHLPPFFCLQRERSKPAEKRPCSMTQITHHKREAFTVFRTGIVLPLTCIKVWSCLSVWSRCVEPLAPFRHYGIHAKTFLMDYQRILSHAACKQNVSLLFCSCVSKGKYVCVTLKAGSLTLKRRLGAPVWSLPTVFLMYRTLWAAQSWFRMILSGDWFLHGGASGSAAPRKLFILETCLELDHTTRDHW